MRDVVAIDLFCGAGGLTRGLLDSGINVKAGFDIDPTCEYPYTFNNGCEFYCQNIAQITAEQIKSLFGRATLRVLVGCAPCQPYSKYQRSTSATDKEKWAALRHFQRLVVVTRPDVVSMENVPLLSRSPIFKRFVQTLVRLGYRVEVKVVDGPSYGVPQTRKRLVLLASLLGPIELLEPKRGRIPTVRAALAGLPELEAGQCSESDPLHRAAALNALNLERIRHSRPGGTWRDWPMRLRADCHKRETGDTYPSVYGRMEWDAPGSTLTTQFFGYGNGRFGHPEQNRALSLREGAMLQTFPSNYKFEPDGVKLSAQRIGKLIGNAVPVALARIVGKSIKEHLLEHHQ